MIDRGEHDWSGGNLIQAKDVSKATFRDLIERLESLVH
ncbi:hypothetical protein N826_07450 [Skermanella aerolata KACC 11604]|nr:hypothetical protein N826_07450 [Skermanella aerolata KACC 11604]